MKKVILKIAFFLLIKLNAYSQSMWVGFPITVTQVNVNATDSYLVYSVFDTLINATVVDSTPVYSDQVNYNNSGPLLGYMVQWNDTCFHIFYNHNLHLFTKESYNPYYLAWWDPNGIFGPPNIFGNYFDDYLGDGGYGQVFLLTYADIVNNSFMRNEFFSDNDFGSWAGYSAGWFYDWEGGDASLSVPGYINAVVVQPGMAGMCGASSYDGFGPTTITDGIMNVISMDNGETTILYCSNDGLGYVSMVDPLIHEAYNGVVWYSDSAQVHIASDDAITNVFNQITFPIPYDINNSNAIFKDRVFTFAANINANAIIYFAAYNFTMHQWVVDSVLSNHVDSLTITNGTISWIDSSGTQFTRGYADTSGWGAFNTPLQIEFSLENMQSPTNGNLVYVRNYTIGSDQTTFDFGDGYVTTKKSESHLYRNPNGTYRTTSSNFNYNICLNANGQSNCKPVSFVLSTQNLAPQNSPVSIRYDNAGGKFLLDNSTNKTLQVTLYNLMGQAVKTFVAKDPLTRFDLLNKANGVYLVQVMSTDGSVQQSIKIINY